MTSLRSVGGGAEAPLAELVEHDLADRLGRVEADEVEQLERAHRVVRAALHRRVDLLDRAEALLEGADRVEQVRDQQAVDDEARLVARVDDRLVQDSAELEARLERAACSSRSTARPRAAASPGRG